jgi:histidinol-phosphatase
VRVISPVSRATGRGSWHPNYIPGIAGSPLSSPAAAPSSDLELALALADAADALTMARFRATDLVVETKPDTTPVTEADRAVEEMLRARLAAARPDDSILGEEFGSRDGVVGDGPRRWVVDPIDGTMGYARGVPVWATLLALVEDGIVTTGVVSAPALGARWWAGRGEGAWRDGNRVSVSRVHAIEDAQLSYSSVGYFEQAGIGDEFLALARRCWRSRAFGDFWSHMLVADGSVDIAIEVGGLAPWDLAALQVVVEEAGGRFTDRAGVAGFDRGEAVTTNGLLHDEVLAALRTG